MPNKVRRAHVARTKHRRDLARRRTDRQRRETFEQLAHEQRQRRRKRITIAVALTLALVAIGLGILLWPEQQKVYRLTSPVVAAQSPELAIVDPPVAYEISYRFSVIDPSGNSSDHLQTNMVRRPFDDHIVFRPAENPEGPTELDLIENRGMLSVSTAGAPMQASMAAPSLLDHDPRFDVVLPSLISSGLYERREQRMVLDRKCTVFRTGASVESDVIRPATDETFADVCIDDKGLMLESLTVEDGKPTIRIIATSLSLESPPDAVFLIDAPLTEPDAGGAVLSEVSLSVAPTAIYYTPGQLPTGFEHRYRYLLREQQESPETEGPPSPKDTYHDVYVKGAQMVVISQGPIAFEPQANPETATEVDVAVLGEGKLRLSPNGSTIVAAPTPEWFVHITGNITSDDALALARSFKS